jgi:hypothetical protein
MLALANLRFHERGGGRPRTAREGEREPAEPGREAMSPERSAAESVVAHRLELGEPGEDGARDFRLELTIEPGWHVYAPVSSEESRPHAAGAATRLEAHGAELLDLRYPEGEPLGEAPDEVDTRVYRGRAAIAGRLRGGGRLVLSFQPCDDRRCLLRVERPIPLGP